MMTSDKHKVIRAVRRTQLQDDLRQIYEQTLDERVDRCLEINHQGIVENHHFAAASSECIDLYRDGHFISAVMVSQAVNEGILRFVADRNSVKANEHQELLQLLVSKDLISQDCASVSELIWGSFRNDVHHMNPKVASIQFKQLAKQNLQALAAIEREIFAVSIKHGKLVPKQPKYWDIQDDGTVPVFLRLGI